MRLQSYKKRLLCTHFDTIKFIGLCGVNPVCLASNIIHKD